MTDAVGHLSRPGSNTLAEPNNLDRSTPADFPLLIAFKPALDHFRLADHPSGAVGGVGLRLPFCATIGPPCILAKGGSERAWEL